jgi:tetratricopeptide (TPR) repeat protein
MGQLPLAIQAYLEATRLDPRMVDAHHNLGNLYLETGRYPLAISHYKKVLQLRPNWDRALASLAQAEEAMGVARPATPEAAQTKPAAPPGPAKDMDRAVDPMVHGDMLTTLHRATIDSESQGRQFLQVLEQQIEPAIKELATRLLATGTGRADLGQCVHKFESAIESMRLIQRNLENSIQKVRDLGEKLLDS